MQSMSGCIAWNASRTPTKGPQLCTMSAMAALTPLPHRIARSISSDGFSLANAAMPVSDSG